VSYPRALLGGHEISRGGREKIPCRLGVPSLHVGYVDDGIDPRKGVVEAFAGGYVNAVRAGNHDGLVPGSPQGLDGVTTGDTCATDYCNTH